MASLFVVAEAQHIFPIQWPDPKCVYDYNPLAVPMSSRTDANQAAPRSFYMRKFCGKSPRKMLFHDLPDRMDTSRQHKMEPMNTEDLLDLTLLSFIAGNLRQYLSSHDKVYSNEEMNTSTVQRENKKKAKVAAELSATAKEKARRLRCVLSSQTTASCNDKEPMQAPGGSMNTAPSVIATEGNEIINFVIKTLSPLRKKLLKAKEFSQ